MNVNVQINKSDNPEDHSLEIMQITVNLTDREVDRLDQLRGEWTVVQYVRRALDLQRDPEHIEEDLAFQARADEAILRRSQDAAAVAAA